VHGFSPKVDSDPAGEEIPSLPLWTTEEYKLKEIENMVPRKIFHAIREEVTRSCKCLY
jgi:hypothetical protein